MTRDLFTKTPPEWAIEPMHGGADQCGICGAWMMPVRPGSSECINEKCPKAERKEQ